MDEKPAPTEERRQAELVVQACIRTALEAYEGALQDGLCPAGAFEVAIGAMRRLDLEALLVRPPVRS